MVEVDPLPNSLSTNTLPPSNKRIKAADAPISFVDDQVQHFVCVVGVGHLVGDLLKRD